MMAQFRQPGVGVRCGGTARQRARRHGDGAANSASCRRDLWSSDLSTVASAGVTVGLSSLLGASPLTGRAMTSAGGRCGVAWGCCVAAFLVTVVKQQSVSKVATRGFGYVARPNYPPSPFSLSVF
ncbi:hypothetical protein NL676_009272 [Syzygium grande]|nr:hypothetical protein NL676_009272 [Syzygium grande]